MKLQPIDDKILVLRDIAKDSVTKGGIIKAASIKEPPQVGTVLATGGGRYENGQLMPMRVRVGDRVVFQKYGMTELPDELTDGEPLIILPEDDVLGILPAEVAAPAFESTTVAACFPNE